tara:strand:+ start:3679 stop:4197 length:519 start_codon:yes stop_codon:yes gene_type:complete
MNIKKQLLLLLLVSFGLSAMAQRLSDEKREKMEKLKVAYLLVELELDEQKSAAFKSLYDEYQEKKKELWKRSHDAHKQMKEAEHDEEESELENLSETEAQKALDERIELEEQKLALEKEYLEKMVALMGAKKVLQMKKAEHSFKRELLHMYKDDKKRHHMEKELIEKRRKAH